MNILYVGHEDQMNGASKSLIDLISRFESTNNIYVLTAYNYGDFYDELKQHKVHILYYPFYRWIIKKTDKKSWMIDNVKWYLKRTWINRKTVREVAAIVEEKHIDLIHTNSSVVHVGALIAEKTGICHIWHIREFADLDFNMFPYRKSFYEKMQHMADKFICNSQAVSRHYDFLPNEKKVVVYNGVDDKNIISREEHCDNGEQIHFLIAGRYSLAKGQDDAIAAAEILYNEGISNFVLHLAGGETLEAKVPEILKDKVVLHGFVKDMPELRRKIDVELVCSRAEAFGRVTIEAMMGGIPVVGSKAGGTEELIIDGEDGLLYEMGNREDLASKMRFIIVNTEARILMSEKASRFAEKFTADRCADNVAQIYEQVLGERH